MTIIEALKISNKVRRTCPNQSWRHFSDGFVHEIERASVFGFSKADLLATDWEAQEQAVMVTKSDVKRVVEQAVNKLAQTARPAHDDVMEVFIKGFGL